MGCVTALCSALPRFRALSALSALLSALPRFPRCFPRFRFRAL
jgi:hypothetical protein